MKLLLPILVLSAATPLAAKKPADRPPGAVDCIDPHLIDSRSAEGDDTILFRSGSRAWRNHLRGVCPGLYRLNQFNALETEPGSGQLCDGDTVRVLDNDTFRAGGIAAAPRCILGWFEPVTPPKP